MTFKLCTICTPRYQKPLKVTRKKCPVCGANRFRKPTPEELEAHEKVMADREALILKLLEE
jgi:predicted  nucleic acid-binding Zn-ribbon protein